MEKVVVYSMSRSYGYHRIVPALNSLLMNGGGVDAIYILAEDDDIGLELPSCVHVMNMSGQTYFSPTGPNYHSIWTYMSLMQLALPKIFPDLDRVLNLCCDTIVMRSIADLWEIQLDDYYLAGVPEPYKTNKYMYTYVNCGVVMMNLAKFRETGMDDEILHVINHYKYTFVNQDCINRKCQNKILALPKEYNSNEWTGRSEDPIIRHFAGEQGWYDWAEEAKKYNEINGGRVIEA